MGEENNSNAPCAEKVEIQMRFYKSAQDELKRSVLIGPNYCKHASSCPVHWGVTRSVTDHNNHKHDASRESFLWITWFQSLLSSSDYGTFSRRHVGKNCHLTFLTYFPQRSQSSRFLTIFFSSRLKKKGLNHF